MRRVLLTILLSLIAGTSAWAEPPTTCGNKGQPDCPMQSWMKGRLLSTMRTQDMRRLAAAMEQLAELEPKGYQGWADSALSGARAAHAGDMSGVRASCKKCHDELRARYRDELRAVPVP